MKAQIEKHQPANEVAWVGALVCAASLFGLALQGMDANWDLRNYHLYNPHAWLTGRSAVDIAPAQLQGFHNPILDLPLYWLQPAQVWVDLGRSGPRLLGMIFGIFGIAAVVLAAVGVYGVLAFTIAQRTRS